MRDGPVRDRIWRSAPQHTTTSLLLARLGKDPDSEYLDVCGTKLSAAQVADSAARLGGALVSLGVKPGDRVAILLENSPEATLAWWGAQWAGAIAVPVNTAYKGEYLRHQLRDSGSSALVVADDLADRRPRSSPISTGWLTSPSPAPGGRGCLAASPSTTGTTCSPGTRWPGRSSAGRPT